MYLLAILLWIVAVVWLSLRLTKKHKNPFVRAAVVVAAVPLSVVLVLADEIIGKYQFDKLCEEAKEVKVHATHPVGEELYTPEGKWRKGETRDEDEQLRDRYESLVRWDLGPVYPEVVPAVITIWKYHGKIFDRAQGRLLAEWIQYGTSGGWLSRNLQGPILVRSQCIPEIGRRLDQRILPFNKNSEDRK